MPSSSFSARLTRGTKVEVFTRKKDVVSGSWLPATILSGNGHSYLIQFHEDFPPGFPVAYDRVPRKAIRPPRPLPLPVPEKLFVSEVSSSWETTGSSPWSTKKRKVADRQIAYRVPDLNVAEIEEDDAMSVGSNSPGRDEGSMLCHREELNQYRSLMTALYMSTPTITWAQYDNMRYICESLGVTLSEHIDVVGDLVLGRKTNMTYRHQAPDDDDDDALSSC